MKLDFSDPAVTRTVIEKAIGDLLGERPRITRDRKTAIERYEKAWLDTRKREPEPGSSPNPLLDCKYFELIYDPAHPNRMLTPYDREGYQKKDGVALKQGEAFLGPVVHNGQHHKIELLGRRILKRWADLVAADPKRRIMTGRQLREFFNQEKERHFPGLTRDPMRAFQDYMTVFPMRGLARRVPDKEIK